MCSRCSRIGLFAPAILVVAGACTPIRPEKGKSPLARAQMSADSCVLDILFVRFPFGQEEANGSLWDEIDEQHLPADMRRRLARDGFRVGLVGGRIPPKLAQMLDLADEPVPTGQCQQVSLEELESVPTVVRQHLQLRAGRRHQVVVSGIYDELPVLQCTADGVCGESYRQAQGVLAVESFPEPDGRVRLEFVPEVHYGQYGPTVAGHQHAFRIETKRPQKVYDEMAFSATLTPGDMLVLSSLPNRPGSLGHRFFTHERSGQLEQKLLVIRLSQTQHDDLFSPQEVLAMEDLDSGGP